LLACRWAAILDFVYLPGFKLAEQSLETVNQITSAACS
jgi:hypothetical protein